LEPEELVNLPQKSRRELLEERLMVIVLKSPQNLNLIEEEKNSYFSPKTQEILTNFKKDPNFSSEKLSPVVQNYFSYLSLKAEVEEIEEKDIEPEIKICLKEIQSLEIKNKLDELSKEIKKAEEEKNSKKIEELTQEFNKLATELSP